MKSKLNKWLIVKEDVVLTKSIDEVISDLEDWYKRHACRSYVTSGRRTPEKQFYIIKSAAMKRGIDKEFPGLIGSTLNTITVLAGRVVPVWLPVWSRLLTVRYLVNPPQEARCMFDYVHPSKGKIKAGTLIMPSPHFKGTAFDIGGRGESEDKTITDELAVLKDAFDSKTIPGLLSYTIERENNALHCDCKKL
jgi:hypothetical protein